MTTDQQNKLFSRQLNESLDILGYSSKMVAKRRERNKVLDKLYNTEISKFTELLIVTVGSKGEGVAKYFESDIDRFYSHTDIVCVDDQRAEKVFTEDGYPMTMFYCDSNECSSGYTRLKLLCLSEGLYKDVVEQSLQDEDDGRYLRNDFPKTRPETPLFDTFGGELQKQDDTEWRICYTEAELILFESLNEFHVKVYLLLKLISKFVLRPICDRISSYIIKNVIFWTAEENPVKSLTGNTLFERYRDALVFLQKSIEKGWLGGYIIYHRNLLEDRISPEESNQVIARINEILRTDMEVFSMTDIGKVLNASSESKEELIEKNKRREKAENLLFEKNKAFKRVECKWFQKKGEIDMPAMLADDTEFTSRTEELKEFILHDLQVTESNANDTETFKQRLCDLLS